MTDKPDPCDLVDFDYAAIEELVVAEAASRGETWALQLIAGVDPGRGDDHTVVVVGHVEDARLHVLGQAIARSFATEPPIGGQEIPVKIVRDVRREVFVRAVAPTPELRVFRDRHRDPSITPRAQAKGYRR